MLKGDHDTAACVEEDGEVGLRQLAMTGLMLCIPQSSWELALDERIADFCRDATDARYHLCRRTVGWAQPLRTQSPSTRVCCHPADAEAAVDHTRWPSTA